MSDDSLQRLSPILRELTRWFEETRTPYVVIGGVAMALSARARNTKDIDAVVFVEDRPVNEIIASGAKFEFVPRIANPVRFAHAHRMLLMKHEPSGTPIDISLGGLAFERLAIENSRVVTAKGISVRVPAIDDLIVMKAVASRPQDLADIDALLNANPKVDRDRIRALVAEFAEAMDRPEIVDALESLLAKKRKHR